MQTLEQANERAANLYWLAYLITGDSEPSLDMAIAALDSEDGANPFFSSWMLAWSRRVVIAKALASIRDELAESARRTASRRTQGTALPPRSWAVDHDTTGVQLEHALLAVDLFPR